MTAGQETFVERIRRILLEHGVKKASLFGSMAGDHSTEDSDIDVLVELDEDATLLDIIDLKLELEDETGRCVDLVEYSMIKPALRKAILEDQVSII